MTRRILLALAALATLLAIFYTEENWRGKRAWQNYRHGLQAQGIVVDWAASIPPPVPDDQNILKAPKISEWFVKNAPGMQSPNELSRHLGAGVFHGSSNPNNNRPTFVRIAELTVAPEAKMPDAGTTNIVWRAGTPEARHEGEKLVQDAVGPTLLGAQGILLLAARPLEEFKPVRVLVQADQPPSAEQLRDLFPTNTALPGSTRLRVEPSGTNSFGVWLSPPAAVAAADYLDWDEQCATDFELIREALKRPYARMVSDYQQPFAIPIPNFVTVRIVAQTLAQRAQCYLLLGQPEAAWRELALVPELCKLLEARPTGKPMTLVSAMIHVAVTGLYAQIVADGLRLGAWREPQLAAIEEQLKDTDLLPYVSAAFDCERLGVCRTLEITSERELGNLFYFGTRNATLWQRIKEVPNVLVSVMPRGWIYQNMISCSALDLAAMDAIDVSNRLVMPVRAENSFRGVQTALGRFSPYTFFARYAVPNFVKATQTLARNQTMANEARIACALERYHLAHGEYPENLPALAPQYLEHPPRDLMNGEPLKYRKTPEGSFVLYSVGWNQTDDGGAPGKTVEEGDWVWGKL